MIQGLTGGLLWALDTVLLSLALLPFGASLLAPLAATFLHDSISAACLWLYLTLRRQLPKLSLLKSKAAWLIVLGALLGGPIGMGSYVSAIYFIGPSLSAAISSLYPALGMILGAIFFKEKIRPIQVGGLALCLAGVVALSLSQVDTVRNLGLGIGCAIACMISWALEGLLVQKAQLPDEQALLIRQTTSALTFALVLVPAHQLLPLVLKIAANKQFIFLILAALAGTASYLCYYGAIQKITAAKAMPLNSTYVAWALVFSALLLHTPITLKEGMLAAVIIAGAVLSARSKESAAES